MSGYHGWFMHYGFNYNSNKYDTFLYDSVSCNKVKDMLNEMKLQNPDLIRIVCQARPCSFNNNTDSNYFKKSSGNGIVKLTTPEFSATIRPNGEHVVNERYADQRSIIIVPEHTIINNE